MTARERLAPLAARLRAALADEKQRVNLLVCMGLAGLLLLAVSSWLPADSSTQSAAPAAKTGSTADYAAELETRLTALISRVEGAGKTAVMVTLESGSESIYATDTDSDGSSTHVLLGSGGADGLVETVETPRVLGVAVVCEGGGSAAVQSRVTALVQALTGIGTNHTGAGSRRVPELVLLPRGPAQSGRVRHLWGSRGDLGPGRRADHRPACAGDSCRGRYADDER